MLLLLESQERLKQGHKDERKYVVVLRLIFSFFNSKEYLQSKYYEEKNGVVLMLHWFAF